MTYLELIEHYDLIEIWDDVLSQQDLKRRIHNEGVIGTAYKLAKSYGADCKNAVTAAMFHDFYRGASDQELNGLIDRFGLDKNYKGRANLSHGRLAAELMRERYSLTDEDLLNAVRYHTTGRAGMSLLEKIIFIADIIEPAREFDGVEAIRLLAYEDLDAAVTRALEGAVDYVRARGELLDENTVQAYRYMMDSRVVDSGQCC